MKQWYESLFENYAKKYDNESFTQGTSGECDFIEDELGYSKSLKILDIGCGTGRHSIELTKRGYDITGVDLSDSQLARAKEKAASEGLKINFLKHDARNLPFSREFDAAIMLCEGGFSLMETDEMNYAILKCAASSLKENGKLIFTALNGLFPLYHSVKKFHKKAAKNDNTAFLSDTFDLMTFRDHNTTRITDDSGNKITLECSERFYIPTEITWMLKSLGYKKIDIYGAHLGEFSRKHKLTTGDFEMLVIAQ